MRQRRQREIEMMPKRRSDGATKRRRGLISLSWSLRRFVASSLLLLPLTFGCGYQHSGEGPDGDGYRWRSLYPQNVQTVAVPIFNTRDFARGVEFKLTKAVIGQLEARTPYKVVPRERADTILEGEIIAVRVDRLSNDLRANLPQEQLLTLSVHFTWKDLRSGKVLVERRNFEQSSAYYPTLGEGRFVGSQQAIEELALAIVQELQADW